MLSNALEVEIVPVLIVSLFRSLVNIGTVKRGGGGIGLDVIGRHIHIDVPDSLELVHLDGGSRHYCFCNGIILLVVELGLRLRLNHLLLELLYLYLKIGVFHSAGFKLFLEFSQCSTVAFILSPFILKFNFESGNLFQRAFVVHLIS